MKDVPQIGDIWIRHSGYSRPIEYLLILEDGLKMGMHNREGYRFLVMGTGEYDQAWIEHFNKFCKFHS